MPSKKPPRGRALAAIKANRPVPAAGPSATNTTGYKNFGQYNRTLPTSQRGSKAPLFSQFHPNAGVTKPPVAPGPTGISKPPSPLSQASPVAKAALLKRRLVGRRFRGQRAAKLRKASY